MEDFKRKTNNIFIIKETLKNQLNILGAEITNITTFRAYADWLDTWTDNLYKKIRDITVLSHNGLYGKTSQNASPTPEYPSEVKTFSGEQTVTIEATNIFNFDYFTDTSSGLTTIINGNNLKVTGTATSTQKYVTNYIQKPFERGKYVFSISKELPLRFILRFYNNGSTMFSFNIMPGQTSTVIDLDEPVEQYRLILNPVSDTTYNIDVDVKLEKGEEIENQSFPVSLKSKNLFDASTIVAGDIKTGSPTIRLSSRQIIWLEEGTYTFSCDIKSPFRYVLQIQDEGKVPLDHYPTYILDTGWQTSANTTYTFTLSKPGWFNLGLSKENNVGLVVGDVANFKYQLEHGSEATEYEPFYDIELCDIGGSQDILYRPTGEGKNLLDAGIITENRRLDGSGVLIVDNNYATTDFIKVNPLENYTYSRYQAGGGSASVCFYKSDKSFISRIMWGSGNISKLFMNISTPEETEYVRICDLKTLIDYMQLEKGSESTEYEEFTAGKWRMVKYTGKYVFTDNENWESFSYGTRSWKLRNILSFNPIDSEILIISNIFEGIKKDDRSQEISNSIYVDNSTQFVLRNTAYSTISTIRDATKGNYVYYVLANPIEETLTEEKYPTLYKQLDDINDYLIKRFIKKEFLAELDKPVIKEED